MPRVVKEDLKIARGLAKEIYKKHKTTPTAFELAIAGSRDVSFQLAIIGELRHLAPKENDIARERCDFEAAKLRLAHKMQDQRFGPFGIALRSALRRGVIDGQEAIRTLTALPPKTQQKILREMDADMAGKFGTHALSTVELRIYLEKIKEVYHALGGVTPADELAPYAMPEFLQPQPTLHI